MNRSTAERASHLIAKIRILEKQLSDLAKIKNEFVREMRFGAITKLIITTGEESTIIINDNYALIDFLIQQTEKSITDCFSELEEIN